MALRFKKTVLATSVAVLAGAATYVALPAGAAAAPQLQFTYVYYDSPGTDNRSNASLNAEYVRIHNNGPANNLNRWTLKDAANHTFTFPNLPIARGANVWVKTGKGTNSSSTLFWGQGNYVWNNDKDTATLRSASGRVYDTCSWSRTGTGRTGC
jgi:hypothetical protein